MDEHTEHRPLGIGVDGQEGNNLVDPVHECPRQSLPETERKPGVAQRINEHRAYLPWNTPVTSSIAGFGMFPFAALFALMPFITSGNAWSIVAGFAGGLLLAATGAHLLWEAAQFGKLQDAASSSSDPERPLVYGKLTLGTQLRWFAIDAALFSSALLVPWLIRLAGRWAQHR
jgi:hypothetical protein